MISATTKVAAVIGDPVQHSLSPAIHNAAFEALGCDWQFVALRVTAAELAPAVAGMRALGLGGLSVTMPHKSSIGSLLDRLSLAADTTGAVNCVTREGLALVGHNTDGDGLVDCLREAGFEASGSRCLILGAGGAARAAAYALGVARADVVGVWSRRAEAAAAAATLAGPAGRSVAPDAASYDLVVNATPLGMRPSDPLPLAVEGIGAGQTVVDLAYAAGTTPLIAAAAAAGAVALDGTGPLLHQAARAFELWIGQPAPLEVMRAGLRTAQDEAKLDR
ncbi:MAG TPA: shikimate dehydrogenase [Acidimicrobiales bacterium]|nr:shikimate dehydrogenase [Acidimicrobiales bacterium]